MLYYELPTLLHIFDPNYMKLSYVNNMHFIPYISSSLHNYLDEAKNDIHQHPKEWDTIKKYTNPYEFIHTSFDNSIYKGVSAKKPLSRAYFKMIELIKFTKLFDSHKYKPIQSFHIAEGPGGFIEAFVERRNCAQDKYIGMSLEDDDSHLVPGWKKSAHFLKNNPNVFIEKGPTNNGDLFSLENFYSVSKNYGNQNDFITADGGFDFSSDYKVQELLVTRLLFTQVIYAIILQKQHGTFILKIFDVLHKSTCDIIFILTMFYEKVAICKPNTSRIANSEKYIVCKNFKYTGTQKLIPHFAKVLEQMKEHETNNDIHITSIYDKMIPLCLKNKLIEINAIFGQQQIENIKYTVRLIQQKEKKYDKLSKLKKANIQKALTWCIEHKVPSLDTKPTNIFKQV